MVGEWERYVGEGDQRVGVDYDGDIRDVFFFKQKTAYEILETYLSGKVIDIGCGDDRVVPHAEPFDQQHGDANLIDVVREPGSYDCVYSSHCLEHMHDPVDALARWWRLVMSSGFLIIVVPDEDLYEQGVWPSRFNSDHKATFRLGREDSWSPCSYDIVELVANLSGAKVISAEVQDQGYDHTMKRIGAEGAWSNLLRQQMMGLWSCPGFVEGYGFG